jgi:hypothetical protein
MAFFARRRIRSILFGVAAAASVVAVPARASGQVIRGVVRSAANLEPVASARLTLHGRDGEVLGGATTDSMGRFALRSPGGGPFDLRARRLGFELMETPVKEMAPGDTAEFEFLMVMAAAVTEAVTITAAPSLNERRLDEAYRRGWRVYEPERVAQHREKSHDLFQLLRALGATGLVLPQNPYDCIRTLRDNRCLTYVVDNQVLGTSASVLPSDIYFIAILGASEARIQFGERAGYGAIAIYTRSRMDREKRRPPPG